MYTRVRDCFNRPICSVPGGEIDLLDRESEDWNWTFRYVTQELVNRLLNLALKMGLVGQKGRVLYTLGWTFLALLIAIAYFTIQSIISDTLSSTIANRCAQFPTSETRGRIH